MMVVYLLANKSARRPFVSFLATPRCISAMVISAYSSPPIFARVLRANLTLFNFKISHLGLLGTVHKVAK